MAKRLGKFPKGFGMSSRTDAKRLLWELLPPEMHDTRGSWFIRLARHLGWNERRVRAIWHGEARIITADEWRQLNEELAALSRSAQRRQETLDELTLLARSVVSPSREAARPLDVVGDADGQARPRRKRGA